MDIGVVSMSWLLWIALQWTCGCICLFQGYFCLDVWTRVGLMSCMVVLYRFLRYLHTDLHSGFTSSYTHQQCRRVPIYQHPPQPLLFVDLLVMATLTGVRWYPLICIFLIIRDVDLFFMYLLAMKSSCTSSLEKCLFRCPFFHWVVGFFAVVLIKLLVCSRE